MFEGILRGVVGNRGMFGVAMKVAVGAIFLSFGLAIFVLFSDME